MIENCTNKRDYITKQSVFAMLFMFSQQKLCCQPWWKLCDCQSSDLFLFKGVLLLVKCNKCSVLHSKQRLAAFRATRTNSSVSVHMKVCPGFMVNLLLLIQLITCSTDESSISRLISCFKNYSLEFVDLRSVDPSSAKLLQVLLERVIRT